MTNDRSTVQLVVGILGLIALVLALGDLTLVAIVIRQPKIDQAAAIAVGAVGQLLGTTIGALGAMLVSTRSVDPDKVAEQAKTEQAAGLAALAAAPTAPPVLPEGEEPA